MINCIFVGLGGFVGSVCRYLIGLIPLQPDNGFPVKTLAINIIGSFLIGLIAAFAAKFPNIDPRLLLMMRVGICGGFTTFSTFAYESLDLFKSGSITAALSYVILSVVLSISAVLAAQLIVR